MSDNKSPFAGLMDYLEEALSNPEKLETLAQEAASKLMSSIGIPTPENPSPKNNEDFAAKVADHDEYHRVGAITGFTYTTHPYKVQAILFDGDNGAKVIDFLMEHGIDFAVKSGGHQIYVAAPDHIGGSPVELEPETFIVYRPTDEHNIKPVHTLMTCVMFQRSYALPESTNSLPDGENDFEVNDDAFESNEPLETEDQEDDSVTELEAELDKGDVYPSDVDDYGRTPGDSHYGHFHG